MFDALAGAGGVERTSAAPCCEHGQWGFVPTGERVDLVHPLSEMLCLPGSLGSDVDSSEERMVGHARSVLAREQNERRSPQIDAGLVEYHPQVCEVVDQCSRAVQGRLDFADAPVVSESDDGVRTGAAGGGPERGLQHGVRRLPVHEVLSLPTGGLVGLSRHSGGVWKEGAGSLMHVAGLLQLEAGRKTALLRVQLMRRRVEPAEPAQTGAGDRVKEYLSGEPVWHVSPSRKTPL